MLIGNVFTRSVIPVSAAISLIGGFVLVAVEYPGFVPIGSYVPDAPALLGMATEIGEGVVIATLAAMVVRTISRRIAGRLAQRKTAQSS